MKPSSRFSRSPSALSESCQRRLNSYELGHSVRLLARENQDSPHLEGRTQI